MLLPKAWSVFRYELDKLPDTRIIPTVYRYRYSRCFAQAERQTVASGAFKNGRL
jgi:hypothetical protein